jgi:hypothetical protein
MVSRRGRGREEGGKAMIGDGNFLLVRKLHFLREVEGGA